MKTTIRIAIFAAIIIVASPYSSHAADGSETIVVAGGCFWGMESVFDHTKGVTEAVAGYAGGQADTAQYHTVSGGNTGHAESVKVTFDPQQISLSQLLDIYFKVAHDPTELNYQGPDHGPQYRSTVFYATPEQQKAVQDKIAELNTSHAFKSPIATTLEPLKAFYAAEDYHQHYAEQHPYNPYILINDAPKVAELKNTYPAIYKE
jgi:peptide-methionine (S)-S-oxide reductase